MQHQIPTTCAIFCTLLSLVSHVHCQLEEVDPPKLGVKMNNNNGVKTYQTLMKEAEAESMSEPLQRAERRIQNMDESSFFLPGLGVIKEFVPAQVDR